ncbi:MAG: acyl-CoA synthetase [Cyclobacteriaceae bacterium]|nr:acyl-CoA synthetase [Cyclobacteriaceae bacterium]
MLEVIEKAKIHSTRKAVLVEGKTHTYEEVLNKSRTLAFCLLNGSHDLDESRVALMIKPGAEYVAALWAIWQAGGVAVPLCLNHPPPALTHVLNDAGCKVLIVSPDYADVVSPLCKKMDITVIILQSLPERAEQSLPEIDSTRRAMILYTSGTTNLPKGVVTTHKNIQAQIATLVKAWRWSQQDHTLCILPLHHVHGIINVVSCSLWSGALCEFLPEFDPTKVMGTFRKGNVNVFMAVPTIYFKLAAVWDQMNPNSRSGISEALNKMRLMVSGSAALPVSLMNKWQEISGHKLLERYGMTELGMAISNPYSGERREGKVGIPLEGVLIRLCNEKDELVKDEPGEIQVKGENVFLEYWNQPDATRNAFTQDGWFRTGDVAVVEDGYYRIMGRNSVDIIKSGGYKISALEIEETLRLHPMIKDCAVVGLDNEEWGEIVAAAIVSAEAPMKSEDIQTWLKDRIPAYRVPRRYIFVDELPRNAMGKVTKNDVKKQFSI